MTTLLDKLKKHDNDYSSLEPFRSETPLSSSLIIPVYKHAGLFAKMLQRLSVQPEVARHAGYFEIIIINDGSPENIDSIVNSAKFPCPIRTISSPTNQGASTARNKGISAASGELLIFLDSDILLPDHYFVEHWKIHHASPRAVVIGLAEDIDENDDRIEALLKGQELVPDVTKDFRYSTNVKRKNGQQEVVCTVRLMEETDWFKKFGFHHKIDQWTLPFMSITHNLSVRKDLVVRVKGFDVRFKRCGFEDIHLGAKLIAEGCYLIPIRSTGIFRINHPFRFWEGTNKDKVISWVLNERLYEELLQEQFSEMDNKNLYGK